MAIYAAKPLALCGPVKLDPFGNSKVRSPTSLAARHRKAQSQSQQPFRSLRPRKMKPFFILFW